MSKFMLTTKLAMSQLFKDDGRVVAVTLLKAEPNFVTQIKTKETDGYDAVQLGFGFKKRLTKAEKGHVKGLGNFRWLREFRGRLNGDFAVGSKVDASIFEKGDIVDVIGISKGRGFQGVVKRHGFHGGPKTHGTKHSHRAPGSIGATHPQHVIKGRRMAGHMGMKRVTVKNLRIAEVDAENGIISVECAVPGARGSLVLIRKK